MSKTFNRVYTIIKFSTRIKFSVDANDIDIMYDSYLEELILKGECLQRGAEVGPLKYI